MLTSFLFSTNVQLKSQSHLSPIHRTMTRTSLFLSLVILTATLFSCSGKQESSSETSALVISDSAKHEFTLSDTAKIELDSVGREVFQEAIQRLSKYRVYEEDGRSWFISFPADEGPKPRKYYPYKGNGYEFAVRYDEEERKLSFWSEVRIGQGASEYQYLDIAIVEDPFGKALWGEFSLIDYHHSFGILSPWKKGIASELRAARLLNDMVAASTLYALEKEEAARK